MIDETVPLDRLVDAFQRRTLPKAEWTHKAHLRVGLWYLLRHGEAEAFELLRAGISALNEAHGTPNSDHSGYHATITWAFLRLLADVRRQQPPSQTDDALADRAVAALNDRGLLHRHYSPELLATPRARRTVVAPDRVALP
jgi:hypothetical protein